MILYAIITHWRQRRTTMNYTKEQIDTAILTATTTVTPKIMQTLIQNIHKYRDELQSMNATLHLTDDIDSNALLIGIMFTAIQTNNQILRETLYELMGDESV